MYGNSSNQGFNRKPQVRKVGEKKPAVPKEPVKVWAKRLHDGAVDFYEEEFTVIGIDPVLDAGDSSYVTIDLADRTGYVSVFTFLNPSSEMLPILLSLPYTQVNIKAESADHAATVCKSVRSGVRDKKVLSVFVSNTEDALQVFEIRSENFIPKIGKGYNLVLESLDE